MSKLNANFLQSNFLLLFLQLAKIAGLIEH